MKSTMIDDMKLYDDKTPYLEQIMDPVSLKLANMTGKDFVMTMSEEAKEVYLNAAIYWAV
jgi:hypothetical protein